MTSSQFHVRRLMLILSISRDCMLSILQPYGLQGFFSLFPRKFFKSSSSQRITASLSTQEIEKRYGRFISTLAAPEVVASSGAREAILIHHRGALTDVKCEMDGEVPPCAIMPWLLEDVTMTHPNLGTRISEEALSFPYYDMLGFFGSFLRSDNPVPIRGSSDTSTNH